MVKSPTMALRRAIFSVARRTSRAGGARMQELAGEKVLMRIHIGEADRRGAKPLYMDIIDLLRARKLAGATVFRGAMSYGSSAVLHTDAIEVMSLNLPIVIECVDSEDNIQGILPELDGMISGGLITLERADVILYRPHQSGAA
jgi:PII-like signaling protein